MQLIEHMPEEVYHRDPVPKLMPGCKASLSHSIAVKLLQNSPLHGWTAHPKLNPDWEENDDKKFDLGSAAHKVFLETKGPIRSPEESKVIVLPFEDYRKKDAQEARDHAISVGYLPLLDGQWMRVKAMVGVARAFMDSSKELNWIMKAYKPETTMIWEEDGVYFRTRPDLFTDDGSVMMDYKTTDNANPNTWARWIMGNTGADIQAGMYSRGQEIYTGKPGKFFFLIQETHAPYACSAVGLAPVEMELARDKVRAAAALWQRCLASGNWPSYPGDIHWIERPAYIESDWAQGKEYLYDKMFPQDAKHGI